MGKVADIFMITRAEDGTQNGLMSKDGITEDDGVTVQLGIGYLPGLAEAAALGDVTVTVLTTTQAQFVPTAAVAVPDVEAGTQLVTFTL